MPPHKSLTLARIFARTIRTESGCMEWQGAINSSGYGHIKINGKVVQAHRLVMMLSGESIHGQMVLHACDNKLCINPDHLSVGTHKENMRQAKERYRTLAGEKNVSAKLTTEAVRQIRAWAPFKTQKILAEAFGVSVWTITAIIRRQTWKHI